MKWSTLWDHHEKHNEMISCLVFQWEANIPVNVNSMVYVMLQICGGEKPLCFQGGTRLIPLDIVCCLIDVAVGPRKCTMFYVGIIEFVSTWQWRFLLHIVPQGKNHSISLMAVVTCTPWASRRYGIPEDKRMACEKGVNSERQSHNFSSVELVPGFT